MKIKIGNVSKLYPLLLEGTLTLVFQILRVDCMLLWKI